MDFTCSQCGTPLQATATEQVTVVVCSKCNHFVRIPHDGSVATLTYSDTPGAIVTSVAAEASANVTESYAAARRADRFKCPRSGSDSAITNCSPRSPGVGWASCSRLGK